MTKLEELEQDLCYLKLYKTFELIKNKMETNELSDEIIDFMCEMCSHEKIQKQLSAANAVVRVANFPHLKTINDFNFKFQPGINEMKILDLTSCKFIESAQNIVFVGTPGVGKTHLATSIGIAAGQKRISVYFIKYSKLLQNLRVAFNENRLDERLKHYKKYKLLIIDELGFLPIDEIDEKLLFQLVDMRYEHKSTIFTSNITIDKWHTIFTNQTIATAIVDRIVHHSYLFQINGTSYRLKDKIEKSAES